MTPTPTPSPDPARCPECGGGWWEPHRTGCSEPRFPAPSAWSARRACALPSVASTTPPPGEGTERPDTDALRAEADDLDYIALSAGWVGQDWSTEVDRAATTMRRAADWIDAQPPVPLSPAPQADGWTAAELPPPSHMPVRFFRGIAPMPLIEDDPEDILKRLVALAAGGIPGTYADTKLKKRHKALCREVERLAARARAYLNRDVMYAKVDTQSIEEVTQAYGTRLDRDLVTDEAQDLRQDALDLDLASLYEEAASGRIGEPWGRLMRLLCLRAARQDNRTERVLQEVVDRIREKLPLLEDMVERVDPDNEDRDLQWPMEHARLSGKVDGMATAASYVNEAINEERAR